MHLYTSRRRRGKSSRRRRQRQSTRKSYTWKAKRTRHAKRTKRARRTKRSRNKMYGGGNGLGQVLTNTYRFTKNTGLNIYNGFKGNDLDKSANPTLGQFN